MAAQDTDMAETALSLVIAERLCAIGFDDLPPQTVEITKRSLLDALGVSLAASGLGEGCDAFVQLAVSAGGGVSESTILGYGLRVSAPYAAMANGAMAHALDYEDAFDGAPLHPNAPLVAALLAEAEAIGGVSGRDFLTAMAVGCDFTCRLGLSLRTDPASLGWYPPPILGAFGAAVAVARLHRLSPRQLVDALSLTLCQATCAGEIKYSPDSAIRAVRDAFPAQGAVQAARLAAAGVRGFQHPLEGTAGFFRLYANADYDAGVLTDGLGSVFHGEQVSFKIWPSCRGTHAFVEAALALVADHGLDAQDIGEVRLSAGPVQTMLMEPRTQKLAPQSPINAKFSLPFTVGTALTKGHVTLDDFGPESLRDAQTLAMAQRVTYAVIPEWGPERNASGITELVLTDGRTLRMQVDHAKGSPHNPLDRSDLVLKFKDCARRAHRPVQEAEADRWAAGVFALDSEPDAVGVLVGAPVRTG